MHTWHSIYLLMTIYFNTFQHDSDLSFQDSEKHVQMYETLFIARSSSLSSSYILSLSSSYIFFLLLLETRSSNGARVALVSDLLSDAIWKTTIRGWSVAGQGSQQRSHHVECSGGSLSRAARYIPRGQGFHSKVSDVRPGISANGCTVV